jgi:hypothetical protein
MADETAKTTEFLRRYLSMVLPNTSARLWGIPPDSALGQRLIERCKAGNKKKKVAHCRREDVISAQVAFDDVASVRMPYPHAQPQRQPVRISRLPRPRPGTTAKRGPAARTSARHAQFITGNRVEVFCGTDVSANKNQCWQAFCEADQEARKARPTAGTQPQRLTPHADAGGCIL